MPARASNVSLPVSVFRNAREHVDRLERHERVAGRFEGYPDAVEDGQVIAGVGHGQNRIETSCRGTFGRTMSRVVPQRSGDLHAADRPRGAWATRPARPTGRRV